MGPDNEAVMRDLQTNINVPFALVLDKSNDELDLIAKTIMRKDNFTTLIEYLQLKIRLLELAHVMRCHVAPSEKKLM